MAPQTASRKSDPAWLLVSKVDSRSHLFEKTAPRATSSLRHSLLRSSAVVAVGIAAVAAVVDVADAVGAVVAVDIVGVDDADVEMRGLEREGTEPFYKRNPGWRGVA